MTVKGVIAPLVLRRADAAIVADLIAERLAGADLAGTDFAAAPEVGRQLHASLKHGAHRGKDEIRIHTITRESADAAFRFLMLFTHDDTAHLLTDEQGLAICEVIASIGLATMPGGKRKLSLAEIDARIAAFETPETATAEIVERSQYYKLKKLRPEVAAYWAEFDRVPRPPVPSFMRPFLPSKQNPEE